MDLKVIISVFYRLTVVHLIQIVGKTLLQVNNMVDQAFALFNRDVPKIQDLDSILVNNTEPQDDALGAYNTLITKEDRSSNDNVLSKEQSRNQPLETEALSKMTKNVFKSLSTISASSQSSIHDFDAPVDTALSDDDVGLDMFTVDGRDPITGVVALKDSRKMDAFFGSTCMTVDQVSSLSIFGGDFASSIRHCHDSEDTMSTGVDLNGQESLDTHKQQEVPHDDLLQDSYLEHHDQSSTVSTTVAYPASNVPLSSLSQDGTGAPDHGLEEEEDGQPEAMGLDEVIGLLEPSIVTVKAVESDFQDFESFEEVDQDDTSETAVDPDESTGMAVHHCSDDQEEVFAPADAPSRHGRESGQESDSEDVGEVNSVNGTILTNPSITRNNLVVSRYASVKDLQAQARMRKRSG